MPSEMLWINYRELYLQRLETLYRSEYPEQVRKTLERFTEFGRLESRRLAEITNLDLQLYVTRRMRDTWRGKPLSNRTVNNEIDHLNCCFAYAGPRERRGPGRRNLGLMDDPPWHEPLQQFYRDPRTIDGAALQKLFGALELANSPNLPDVRPREFWEAAFLLLFITGLRRGALLRIPRPCNADLIERRLLRLPAEYSKVRKEQVLPLGSGDVAAILAGLPTKPGEPLLPWKHRSGRPLTLRHFNAEMARFQAVAGIGKAQRITSKMFRNSCATEIADAFSTAVAKRRLGHSPTTTTFELHYQGRATAADVKASEHLAGLVLPFVTKRGA